jgi:hypothetical protein
MKFGIPALSGFLYSRRFALQTARRIGLNNLKIPARDSLALALRCLVAAAAIIMGMPLLGWAESSTPQNNNSAASLAPTLSAQKKVYKASKTEGAEVILRKSHILLDAALLSDSQVYHSVAINNEEAARDYSQINIPYNAHFETLSLEFARVLTPEGLLETVLPDAIQVQSPAQENFYEDGKELTFSLPNVRPGSIIEFQYRRKDTLSIMPNAFFARFWLHWWQGRSAGQGFRLDPVIERETVLEAPEGLNLEIYLSDPQLMRQKIARAGNHSIWRWSSKRIPSIILQASMPREDGVVPYISVSTEASWQTVAKWASELFEPHINADSAIKSEVQKIAKTATSQDAKVRAVYQLLNERVRYVFAHVGRGGYEPHSANEVYKNGYGDCKDQTILAVTLLRELGIEAYPALVATRSMGRPNFPVPSVYFDHLITYIPAQKGNPDLWLDTTGDKQLFPGGGVGLEGQPALVVRPATDSLVEIPAKSASQHFARLNLAFAPPSTEAKSADNLLRAHFSLSLGGIYEQSLRANWIYQPEKDKAIADSLANLFGGAKLTNLNVVNGDSLWKPLEISGIWVFDAPWSSTELERAAFGISQLLSVFTGIYQWHKPEERKQDFQLDPGLLLEANIVFKKAGIDGYQELISVGPNIKTPWLSLQQSSRLGDEGYEVNISLLVESLTLNKSDYAEFYRTVTSLLREPNFVVAYNVNKRSAVANAAVKNKNISNQRNKVELMLQEIRKNISDGEFSAALNVAQQTAMLAPESGEAHYLLGLAQGYNELLDEAIKSFELAGRLGYKQP